MIPKILIAAICLALGASVADAREDRMELPDDVRKWYRNPDGSCVQCSLGMCGCWSGVPQFACLLWDTPYGPKVRGGSWPQRVSGYASRLQVPIWNVTGSTTFDWMRWAGKTGRFAAIGAGGNHFQTLYGYDDSGTAETSDDVWYVCNNNSTHKIDRYTDAQFRRLHLASGQWCVVIDAPGQPPVPQYVKWW